MYEDHIGSSCYSFIHRKVESTADALPSALIMMRSALMMEILNLESKRCSNIDSEKRFVFRLLLYSFIIFGVGFMVVYGYFWPSTQIGKLMLWTSVLIYPVLVSLLRWAFRTFFFRQVAKTDERLKLLREEKQRMLEEVMENEKFNKAQQILKRFDPLMFARLSAMVGAFFLYVFDLSGTHTPASDTSNAASSVDLKGSEEASATPTQQTAEKQPRLLRPILPRERSLFDRLVDALVGDGPDKRYALICRECASHNGMALQEEFEYLVALRILVRTTFHLYTTKYHLNSRTCTETIAFFLRTNGCPQQRYRSRRGYTPLAPVKIVLFFGEIKESLKYFGCKAVIATGIVLSLPGFYDVFQSCEKFKSQKATRLTVSVEVNARITFANLHYAWHQNGISLGLKGRVYQATVRAILLYGCEIWPLRTVDMMPLQVFFTNDVIRKRVFGRAAGTSIAENIQHHQQQGFGRVLLVPKYRLPEQLLFSEPPSELRKLPPLFVGSHHLQYRPVAYSKREANHALTICSIDEDRVVPTTPGWGRCKIWLPIDVSGVLVFIFYPDCLNEYLEVYAHQNDCEKNLHQKASELVKNSECVVRPGFYPEVLYHYSRCLLFIRHISMLVDKSRDIKKLSKSIMQSKILTSGWSIEPSYSVYIDMAMDWHERYYHDLKQKRASKIDTKAEIQPMQAAVRSVNLFECVPRWCFLRKLTTVLLPMADWSMSETNGTVKDRVVFIYVIRVPWASSCCDIRTDAHLKPTWYLEGIFGFQLDHGTQQHVSSQHPNSSVVKAHWFQLLQFRSSENGNAERKTKPWRRSYVQFVRKLSSYALKAIALMHQRH
ncbi:protein lunapark-B [Clonorchis sinensis]|uniref:Endoplasmic reticulum junction formation protein lunapark n=1 Tax=Clonorchis sinensis TaxID=79923 RepID=G7YWT2_CLOSI|nr:protein lunapark-B [Clonorchis sinensis]